MSTSPPTKKRSAADLDAAAPSAEEKPTPKPEHDDKRQCTDAAVMSASGDASAAPDLAGAAEPPTLTDVAPAPVPKKAKTKPKQVAAAPIPKKAAPIRPLPAAAADDDELALDDDSDSDSAYSDVVESDSESDDDDDDDDEEDDASASASESSASAAAKDSGSEASSSASASAPVAAPPKAPTVGRPKGRRPAAVINSINAAIRSASNMATAGPIVDWKSLSSAALAASSTAMPDLQRAVEVAKLLNARATMPTEAQLGAPVLGSGIPFLEVLLLPNPYDPISGQTLQLTGNGLFTVLSVVTRAVDGQISNWGFLYDQHMTAMHRLYRELVGIKAVLEQHNYYWQDFVLMLLGLATLLPDGKVCPKRKTLMRASLYKPPTGVANQQTLMRTMLDKWNAVACGAAKKNAAAATAGQQPSSSSSSSSDKNE